MKNKTIQGYLNELNCSTINGSGTIFNRTGNDILKPEVTVYTVALNAVNTIEKTILSVSGLDLCNYEYIVIDGGSTDGTKDIIQKNSKFISYWISERDNGPADATNKAISISRGKYLFWLCADDWLERDYLNKALNALHNNPNAEYIFGNLVYYNTVVEKVFIQSGDPFYYKKIKYQMPRLNTPSMVIRKSAFEKYGLIDNGFYVASDYEWAARVDYLGGIGVYSDTLFANHRLGGISSNNFIKGLNEVKIASLKYGGNLFVANMYFYYNLLRWSIKNLLKKYIKNELYLSIMRYLRKKYELR